MALPGLRRTGRQRRGLGLLRFYALASSARWVVCAMCATDFAGDRFSMTPETPVEHAMDVLVVDDNIGIRKVMRFALEDVGYTVYEAADGVRALSQLRAHPRSLVVLLDLNLPKLDGWGVLRAVVAEKPLATRHRFLLLTAKSDRLPSTLLRLLRLLHAPVITMPFGLNRMLDAVASAASAINAQEAPCHASAHC